MKITYSVSIGNNVKFSAFSTRVLTENLLNNDKIDSHFSNAIFPITYKFTQDIKKARKLEGIELLESYYMRILRTIYSQKYTEDMLNSIKGDYFFYSLCSTRVEYKVVTDALNQGVKVVVGGTEVTMNTFEYVRNMLRNFGTKEKNLKNLMIVNGHISQYTDMIPYIEKWKDVIIPNNHDGIKDIILSTKDYTRFESMNSARKIIDKLDSDVFRSYVWDDCISVVFDGGCCWKKCRFCTYCIVDDISFIKDVSVDDVVEAITKSCNNANCYHVFLADNYFYFTPKKIEILERLIENGITFVCQSGVRYLLNDEYAKNLCKYMQGFSVGLENATDFGLDQLNKGYTWKEALKAFENIKKYYNNNLVTVNIIVDSPVESVENANLNYKRFADLKLDMESHNIKFVYTVNLMKMLDKDIFNSFASLGYIRKPKEGKNHLSGTFMLIEEWRKHTEIPFWHDFDGLPFERLDKNGNLIECDIKIVDEKFFKEVVNYDFFYKIMKR
jgi:hypothetical protein